MATLFVAVLAAFGVLSASAQLNQRIARVSNEATSLTEAIDRVPYVPCAGSAAYTTAHVVRIDDPSFPNAASVTLSLDPAATAWEKAAVYPRKVVLASATSPAATKQIDLNEPVLTAIAGLQNGNRYTASVTKVEYLVDGNATSSTFQASCPGGGDQGVQRITVTVQSAPTQRRISTKLVFTKRDNRCPDAAQRPAEVVDGQPC